MKKFIIITFILTNIFLVFSTSAISQDIARLKNININESTDSIDLNLMSSKNIRYNIINYMNGDVGIKLVNTCLNNDLNSTKNIDISQKESIADATLTQEDPYSVLIKLKGNENLKNKTIKINTDVQRSNFIIIEPVNKAETSSIIPLITNMPDIPEVETLQLSQSLEVPDKEVSLKEPISMYNEKVNTEKYAQGKMLIAQAQPFSDDTSILDLEDKPLSPTSAEEDLLTPPSNASELTPEETIDDLNVDNTTSTVDEDPIDTTALTEPANPTEESGSSENKEPGFFSKIFGFLKAQWIWIAGVIGCGVVGLIVIIVAISVFGNSQGKETTTEEDPQSQQILPEESQPKQQKKQPEAAEIIDNEPVDYIPPNTASSSQSITEAINQIIFIRNKSGK